MAPTLISKVCGLLSRRHARRRLGFTSCWDRGAVLELSPEIEVSQSAVAHAANDAASEQVAVHADVQSEQKHSEFTDFCGWCGLQLQCGCEAAMLAHWGGPGTVDASKLCEASDFVAGVQDESTSAGSSDTASVAHADSLMCNEAEEASLDHVASESIPDFSGRWVLRRHEGDFDEMMRDAGTSWTIRKLAQAANYGIGVLSQQIQHEGNRIQIDFKAGTSTTRMTFTVGEADQRTMNEAAEASLVLAVWEGSSLYVTGVRERDGSKFQDTRRYMQGEEMVVETCVQTGALVRRYFAR